MFSDSSDPNRDRQHGTYLKDTQEEGAEVVKHFGEKVPPHAHVRRQIRYGQSVVSAISPSNLALDAPLRCDTE